MRKIALIGSTGSIGRQVIDVVKAHPDRFEIVAMIAGSSAEEFGRQIADVKPAVAVLTDGKAAEKIGEIAQGISFYSGEQAALKCLENEDIDVAFIACSGFAGLKYCLHAAKLGLDIALANKESLVCGGELIMPLVKNLAPVDSEHSAIWQCLNFNRKAKVKSLIITASGGPFKDKDFWELDNVTPEQALNHPTWKMGKKITIDSATLLNKGYEVIEAHHLYGVGYDRIKTVIQPQSIIHSMVEFEDGAILAQMSNPTMELPIQLALTFPERLECPVKPMDFSAAFSLQFQPLERKKYPLYDLALTCGEAGGILPTALNAASEIAVNAFLAGKIAFTDIFRVADKVVAKTANGKVDCFERLDEADKAARAAAKSLI